MRCTERTPYTRCVNILLYYGVNWVCCTRAVIQREKRPVRTGQRPRRAARPQIRDVYLVRTWLRAR